MNNHGITKRQYSIAEFRELCDTNKYRRFTYSTENQKESNGYLCMSLCVVFKTIVCSLSPNAICLIGEDGSIRFKYVYGIIGISRTEDTWDAFEIICRDPESNTEHKHRILADKAY